MQTPGPVSALQTLQIVQHAKLPLLALLPHSLHMQLVLATEPSLKMQIHTALVSNAIVTASCTHRPFAALPEKLKCLFSPMIINAHGLLMHLKLPK
jgi:hypothetical protein